MQINIPQVAVLLATYNGEKYLSEQLDSIINQTYKNTIIWVSDDGSNDTTLSILKKYQEHLSSDRLKIIDGPQRGFATNFLSLVYNADYNSEFYAYSDQDDIWKKDKLQRAIAWLETIPSSIPALYCSRTEIIDENDQSFGFSPLFKKKLSFANALVQCIAGGNTMVFNQAVRNLLCKINLTMDISSHDWLTYLVVSGVGGKIFYDSYSSVKYRRHSTNLVGTNLGLSNKFIRIKLLLEGKFKKMNEQNINILINIFDHLSIHNKEIFNQFKFIRKRSFLYRLVKLKKSGVYRQTVLGNLGLIMGALFNKI